MGVAVVAVILLRGRLKPAALSRATGAPGNGFLLGLFAGVLALDTWIARSVFSGRPLLIDEIVQLFQARIFAGGRLSLPVAPHREFFSMLHLVDTGDKVYSQFPPGGPAMLMLGELAHAPWIVGPLCGAISAVLFARLLRYTDPGASRVFHVGAAVLFAVAPFGAFMFGSHMNHATAALWLLVAVVGMARVGSWGHDTAEPGVAPGTATHPRRVFVTSDRRF